MGPSMLGTARNVRISDQEWTKLKATVGESEAQDWIEKLSLWMASTGKRRKSHYFTILNWARKDSTIRLHTPVSQPLIEEVEILSRATCLLHCRQREGFPETTLEQCIEAIRSLGK